MRNALAGGSAGADDNDHPRLLELAGRCAGEARVVMAMLDELDRVALGEIERALVERLRPAPSAAERRVAELGLLASLLIELPVDMAGRPPAIEPQRYDAERRRRRSGAPTAETLAARYGHWHTACHHAYGMRTDGSYVGPSRPWSNCQLGRRKPIYGPDDVRRAVRACAVALGRVPSVDDYLEWARRRRAHARRHGIKVTAPSQFPVYRIYPHWQEAVADARLDLVEIARARLQKLLGVAGVPALPNEPLLRLHAAAAADLAKAGFDQFDLDRLAKEGFGWLPLGRACVLAHLLEGSLDWLGGRALDLGDPAPAVGRFDPATFVERLKAARVSVKELRELLGLNVAPYNALVSGREEMVLAELILLAVQLKTAADALVTNVCP